MAFIELTIVGEVPELLDLTPVEKVIYNLNERGTELNIPSGEINLSFVDDHTIRELNKTQAGNDYATDVLSFSYIESGEPIDGVIGEIVISFEMAKKQALETKTDLATEIALLSLHGVLHIAGYDHQTVPDQNQLQTLQAEIMTNAGLDYREFKWEK